MAWMLEQVHSTVVVVEVHRSLHPLLLPTDPRSIVVAVEVVVAQ
jgi:hypothetical protein